MLPIRGHSYQPRQLDQVPDDFARIGLGLCYKGLLSHQHLHFQGNLITLDLITLWIYKTLTSLVKSLFSFPQSAGQ